MSVTDPTPAAGPRVRGVVFDLDGVLVDTTGIQEEVWARFFAERGLEPPRGGIRSLFGRRGTEAVADLLGLPVDSAEVAEVLRGLEEDEEALVQRRCPDGVLVEGAEALVSELAARLPIAVGTSARRRVAEARLGPLRERLSAIVTAEDVVHGKPHPEVYLTAARRLGVEPASCVVVEDAPSGVQAGAAAGALVVGLSGTVTGAALREAGADVVIARLSDLAGLLEPHESSPG